eukprot:358088-Chlamydomonas_euryale.AAC.1
MIFIYSSGASKRFQIDFRLVLTLGQGEECKGSVNHHVIKPGPWRVPRPSVSVTNPRLVLAAVEFELPGGCIEQAHMLKRKPSRPPKALALAAAGLLALAARQLGRCACSSRWGECVASHADGRNTCENYMSSCSGHRCREEACISHADSPRRDYLCQHVLGRQFLDQKLNLPEVVVPVSRVGASCGTACAKGEDKGQVAYAFFALKAKSIIINMAVKARAVLRSAVAAAETVHKGNAYMFQAICTNGPRRRPRRVLRLHNGVCKAQDAIFCASASS